MFELISDFFGGICDIVEDTVSGAITVVEDIGCGIDTVVTDVLELLEGDSRQQQPAAARRQLKKKTENLNQSLQDKQQRYVAADHKATKQIQQQQQHLQQACLDTERQTLQDERRCLNQAIAASKQRKAVLKQQLAQAGSRAAHARTLAELRHINDAMTPLYEKLNDTHARLQAIGHVAAPRTQACNNKTRPAARLH